jgi:hypothetical protein
MTIEAMKLALDALEAHADIGIKSDKAITALRTAIEQAEKQEPVAWAEEIIGDLHACYDSEMIKENDSGDALIRLDAAICAVEEAEKRHTTQPAAQRQWVGLTDEEVDGLWEMAKLFAPAKHFYLLIEAKLKEKNNAA